MSILIILIGTVDLIMRMPQPQAKFEIAKDEMEEEIIPSTYILHVPT
jgi:hypothetical protein